MEKARNKGMEGNGDRLKSKDPETEVRRGLGMCRRREGEDGRISGKGKWLWSEGQRVRIEVPKLDAS